MFLSLLLFSSILLLNNGKKIASETCTILNHYIFPTIELIPDYPKNDICRWRSTPNCCTWAVEDVMRERAPGDARTLLFNHLMLMRDITSRQSHTLQRMELPYLTEASRRSALEYSLADNVNKNRDQLVYDSTVAYLSTYYDMEKIPDFCKERVIDNMKPYIHILLEKLVFASKLVEFNWYVANDLFDVIITAEIDDQCIDNLIESGLSKMSCKSCTDSTIPIPTCFNYCTDVVSKCLDPFQPIVELLNEWFNLNVKVQERLSELIYDDKFRAIKKTLLDFIKVQSQDEHYADVCEYHFLEEDTIQPDYNVNSNETSRSIKRIQRIPKTVPQTQVYSTRYVSHPPTSETPNSNPFVVGDQLLDVDMICFNATKTITNRGCWNGKDVGRYNTTENKVPARTTTTNFDIHIPRLSSKLSELLERINNEFIPDINTDNNDAQSVPARGHAVYLSSFLIMTTTIINTSLKHLI